MAIEETELKGAITAHFQSLQRLSHDVPEWGTTIFYDPITAAERDALDHGDCSDNERLVNLIIKKAQKEDGTPYFTKADKHLLMNKTGANIIRSVALRIATADLVDPKLLGKPSAPNKEP